MRHRVWIWLLLILCHIDQKKKKRLRATAQQGGGGGGGCCWVATETESGGVTRYFHHHYDHHSWVLLLTVNYCFSTKVLTIRWIWYKIKTLLFYEIIGLVTPYPGLHTI